MRIQLENRLIIFSLEVNACVTNLRQGILAYNLSKQVIRSSSSAALNFGEAKGAESDKDFLHKQSIILKELRESYINLLIFRQNRLSNDSASVEKAVDECNQLVRIFTASVLKTKRKLGIEKQH